LIAWRGDVLPVGLDPFVDDPDRARAAAFFDSLIGQQDRNGGNIRWDAGHAVLYVIDQGYAFARPGDPLNASPFVLVRGIDDPSLDDDEIDALNRLLGSGDLLGVADALEDERAEALERRARIMLQPSLLPLECF
jgi:hypothetical protein